jgi:hypothetical protein
VIRQTTDGDISAGAAVTQITNVPLETTTLVLQSTTALGALDTDVVKHGAQTLEASSASLALSMSHVVEGSGSLAGLADVTFDAQRVEQTALALQAAIAHTAIAGLVILSEGGGEGFGLTLTSVVPTQVPNEHSVNIVLTGSGFTGVDSGGYVRIGLIDVLSIIVNSDTQITAVTSDDPDLDEATWNLTVGKPPLSATLESALTYTTVPWVDSITPDNGTHGTGVSITVAGVYLTTIDNVKIDGIEVDNFANVDGAITFDTPVDLTVGFWDVTFHIGVDIVFTLTNGYHAT